MLLINFLDPSKLTSVEPRRKGAPVKLKVPRPAIIKEYNSHVNVVFNHDQLKNSYEIDRKSRFWYYPWIFFDLMDSVVDNVHVIYKKKFNAKMSPLNFKIILSESLIKLFSSSKRKITAEEPQLTVELPPPWKELDHIVRFTGKRQHCQYSFNNGKNDVKSFTYCKSCNVLLRVQKDRNYLKFYHSSWEQLYYVTICWWTSDLLDVIILLRVFSTIKFLKLTKVQYSWQKPPLLVLIYSSKLGSSVTRYFSSDWKQL